MAACALSTACALAGVSGERQTRLRNACEKKLGASESVDKSRRTCECVATNLAQKVTSEEFDLLTGNYADDPKAMKSLKAEKFSPAVDFDLEVATKCSSDPSWRLKAPKKVPKETK